MRNIIVTGASGFIGRTLVKRLQEKVGDAGTVIGVSSKDADLVDRASVFSYFERLHWAFDCDHIFHLAALYKAGGWPVEHPGTQFHVNMGINVNILEAWKRFFPKAKFVSALSYCLYPPGDNAHPESELYGTEPEEYLFSYAFTKKALLIGQRAYQQEFGLTWASGVLPTVYGPGDSFAENSHVMGALIGKFVRAHLQNLPQVEVWGDGNQVREFIYIDDAADALIGLPASVSNQVFNVGTGRSETIRDIAETIKEVVGYKGQIVYNPQKFTGVAKRLMDSSAITNATGWKSGTSLRDGISQTASHYQNQLKTKS
jgi:GDP-L-fucose synthase